jgi:ribose transport system substrate-binding protein
MPFHVDARRFRGAWVVAALAIVLSVAACGSSSSTSTGTRSSAGSSSASTTSPAIASGAADPNKVYAPGVPTLNQLYKGTESSPPATGPKIAKGKSVIFVSCGQASPGCAGPPNAMVKVAKLIGWNYRIIDGADNVGDGWDNGIRQAIAAKPDVIVLHGENCNDVKQALEDAKAAGIPVFGIETADCNDPDNPGGTSAPLLTAGSLVFNATAKNDGQINYQWGENQAAYVIDATKGDAKVIRLFYQGIQGFHMKAGQDAMFKKCSGCQVLDTVPWVATDSVPGGPLQQKLPTVLEQYPHANAFIQNFDSPTFLASVLVQSGRAKDMVIVGGEGYAESLQKIREDQGRTADGCAHSANWEAWATVDELNRFFNHQPFVPEGVGCRVVDKGHNMMAPGQDYESPIKFEAVYKKSWGLG